MSDNQTARLSPEVRRMLLTIQYQRKMAGEVLSFNDIIKRALERQAASQGLDAALERQLASQPVKP